MSSEISDPVLLMYIYHLCIHHMELLLEMSGCLKMQILNCLIKNLILIGHVFIKVLSMKQFIIYNIFNEFVKLCIPSKPIVARKMTNHGTILK